MAESGRETQSVAASGHSVREPSAWEGWRAPWATLALLGLLAGLHAVLAARGGLGLDGLVAHGAKAAPLVREAGQVWRLAVANLLHRDALHLGVNLGVLLFAGGLLECVLRRRDVALTWAVGGLCTMAASLRLSPGVSVGASGVGLASLGALAAWGLRHRGALGPRERRLLVEGAAPLALVLVGLGGAEAGVDRAGHLGGLAAGVAAGLLLPARAAAAWGARRGRGALAALGLLAPALALAAPPHWRTERDTAFGVALALPADWRPGADPAGALAFSNGLPGWGRATLAAAVLERGEPGGGEAEARAFAATLPGAQGPRAARLGGREGWSVRAPLAEGGWLEADFVPRGDVVYRFTFRVPAEVPAYAQVVERVRAGVRFEEPGALRAARARALLVPGAAAPAYRLGEALRRFGEPAAAAEALEAAVRAAPSEVGPRALLARALLEAGREAEGCRAAAEARAYGPADARALEAGARCALARGQPAAALGLLEAAAAAAPGDARLARALEALRALQE